MLYLVNCVLVDFVNNTLYENDVQSFFICRFPFQQSGHDDMIMHRMHTHDRDSPDLKKGLGFI